MKPATALLTALFLLLFTSSSFANKYPDEIDKFVKKATTKIVCEKESPRRIGTIVYKRSDAKWLIRIFTKNGEEMEIWFNKKIIFQWQAFYPNKIFYNVLGQGWIDKDGTSYEEAEKLDARLKFNSEEIEFFKTCAEAAESNKNK